MFYWLNLILISLPVYVQDTKIGVPAGSRNEGPTETEPISVQLSELKFFPNMKRAVPTILFVTSYFVCNGQEFLERLHIAPRVNYFIATFLNPKSPFIEGDFNTKSINSASYGILIQYTLSKKLSLHAGYSKELKGINATYDYFKISGVSTETRFTSITVKNTYNTIPLFLRINLKGEKYLFFTDCGVYGSTLVNSRISYYYSGKIEENGQTVGLSGEQFYTTDKDRTNKIDYGFILGAGVSYAFRPRLSLQLNPQISFGIRKMDREFSNDIVKFYGQSGILILEKDYYDLSSKAKNLLFLLNLSLNYKLTGNQ